MDRPTAWLAAIAAAHVALFAYYLRQTIIVEPFWDMYSYVVRYLQFRENGGFAAYLWEPHVQHRLVWLRLLTAFDIEVFGGVSYPIIAASTICLCATAWLLWRESRRLAPTALGTGTGLLAVMLVLTAAGAVDSAIPINAVYPQALLFTILAFVLFDNRDEARTATRPTAYRRAAALAAACGAPLANAVGLAVWPILLWLGYRNRIGRRWMLLLAGVAVAFTGLYLYGLPLEPQRGPDASAGGSAALTAPIRSFTYLLTYMGLPWTRAEALLPAGRIAGGVLLAAGVWAILRHGPARTARSRPERLAVAFIMFSLASALLAAVGRADVDADVRVPVRYSVFLAPLHVGLLWLAAPVLRRQWALPHRRLAVQSALVAVACALLVQQAAMGHAAAVTTDAMRASIRRFMAGETEPAMRHVVFDNLEEARRSWNTIRAAGLYTGR